MSPFLRHLADMAPAKPPRDPQPLSASVSPSHCCFSKVGFTMGDFPQVSLSPQGWGTSPPQSSRAASTPLKGAPPLSLCPNKAPSVPGLGSPLFAQQIAP